MKKIFFPLITGLALASLLISCKDYNDQFKGLDDLTKPANKTNYSYTMVDKDYTDITTMALKVAANATDSANVRTIGANKYFSAVAPSSVYVPYLLTVKYPYNDLGSAALITSTFGNVKPTYLTDLTTVNIVTDAEYQTVWGDPIAFVSAFTPAKTPATKIPTILATRYPSAVSGTYKFVECNYSSTEATSAIVDFKYFYEDFEAHNYLPSPYAPISENGWVQKDTSGTRTWLLRTFSSNKYAQATSNASNELNNVFLITKQIDLTYGIAPIFTFNVNVGYWNADCLTVWISDDFDGTTAHIKNATWVDLTSNFTFLLPLSIVAIADQQLHLYLQLPTRLITLRFLR
jgi:hypothetical protein